jgi:hypothetical protein
MRALSEPNRTKQEHSQVASDGVASPAEAIRQREKEIAPAFSDGYDFGSVRLCCSGQTLRLGDKTLGVVAPADGADVVPLRLTYESKTVLEIFGWLELDGRAGDGSAEAVVVSTHDYGTAGCSDQYLISVRANEAPRVEPLVVDGDPCWRIFGVKRYGSGLLLTRERRPVMTAASGAGPRPQPQPCSNAGSSSRPGAEPGWPTSSRTRPRPTMRSSSTR